MPPVRSPKRSKNTTKTSGGKTPFFDKGIYFGVVTAQRFGQSQGEKKTPYIAVSFKPTHRADPVDPENKEKATPLDKTFEREASMWISEATIKQGVMVQQLRALGWKGTRFSELDPDSPNFHSFEGVEGRFLCKHEVPSKGKYAGKTIEGWSVFSGGASSSTRKKIENQKGVAAKLDALFSTDMAAYTVAGETPSKASSVPENETENEFDEDVEEGEDDAVEDDTDDSDDLFGPEDDDEDAIAGGSLLVDDIPF